MRVRLDQLIAQRIEEAPKRGKGARRWRFLENVAAVTERYAPGLFHCYDDDQIPHTSNEIEGKNGVLKHHQRKTTGRASTVGGPMETAGELLAGAVDTVKRSGFARLVEGLADVGHSAYEAARRRLKDLREPARRYRSIQRNPERYLEQILQEWEADGV